MMENLKNWLRSRFSDGQSEPSQNSSGSLRATGAFENRQRTAPKNKAPRPSPEYVDVDPHLHGNVEDNGPGKNVLIRNKFVREETGTHETLKILDDSIVDSGEETGIDPYNTGGFDRSRNWDQRFRK